MSITTALIISNVAVFVLGALLPTAPALYNIPCGIATHEESVLYLRGSFSWYTAFAEGELWRLISYQFLHANTMHLLFNMWALYFFGPMVERAMGEVRYLAFYLACGVAGPLFYILLGELGFFATPAEAGGFLQFMDALTGQPGLTGWQLVPMVGASAAIYGVLIAVAYMNPGMRVQLLIPPVNLTLRTLSLVVLGLAVLTVLANGNNAGGEAGHLGGIIMSAIIMSIWKWRVIRRRRNDGIF